ncbi:MAG: glycosyltransferase family 4 protein [Candidatus Portnoybacteria bacterium]|nr:glycosyltransferase family 4 protein [Candidatus Portnoybacteria bacterium]
MTIGIDIRVLTRGTRTGVEEYAINLLSRLLRLDQNINFKLFFNAYNKIKLDYDWISLPNVKLYEFGIPNRFLFISTKYLNYPKIDKLINGADIFFSPHFFTAPVGSNCKKVVTFHDLSFKYHPELFSWRKRFWQRFLMNARAEAKKADKIIAVSESTKQDLVDLYGISPERIKVVYSGVDKELKDLNNTMPEERVLEIREKYNLPDKFILYFGTIEPRKNIAGLIRAFELAKGKNSQLEDFYLVIAGAKGWLCEDIFQAARNCRYASQIIFTGFIETQDKVYLYDLASLLVYPSFFEGFGFSPLEAMACGVPVITSNTSSLPEVVGDAALMIDPYNIGELAWAINEVLADPELKEELIERGFHRAKLFSWDKCAKETLEFLIA